MRVVSLVSAAVLILVAAGCDSASEPTSCANGTLSVQDLVVGTGQTVTPSSSVSVRYIGRLQSGVVFDSTSTAPPSTTRFSLQGVVDGFKFGIGGTAGASGLPEIAPMRLGGRRLITVPPNLGYGSEPLKDRFGKIVLNSAGTPLIPGCSTLIFDVRLVDA